MSNDNKPALAPTSDIPEKIGHYEVGPLIGRGGMGDVYLARHPMLGKRAALKVLKAELCRIPEQVARFQQEAMAVCRIGHPSIVDVFDFGMLPDGRVYYLMEYLDGQSLADLLDRNGTLSSFDALEILAPVAEGLDAAHKLGIVHRDVKPENIFLKETQGPWRVKILDFGIAKLLDNEESLLASATRTGMILGTPAYMAPEQAAGKNSLISPATDVYALAIVFYQMVQGRPPFVAESQIEVLMHHLKTPAPGLTIPNEPLVTQALNSIIGKALAKDPSDRYQSMSEFLGALRRAVELGSTVQSGPPDQESRTDAGTERPGSVSTDQPPGGTPAVPIRRIDWPGTQPGAGALPTPGHATGPDILQEANGQEGPDPARSPTMPSGVGLQADPLAQQTKTHRSPMPEVPASAHAPSLAGPPEGGLPRWARKALTIAGIALLSSGAVLAATVVSLRLVRDGRDHAQVQSHRGAMDSPQASAPENAEPPMTVSPGRETSKEPGPLDEHVGPRIGSSAKHAATLSRAEQTRNPGGVTAQIPSLRRTSPGTRKRHIARTEEHQGSTGRTAAGPARPTGISTTAQAPSPAVPARGLSAPRRGRRLTMTELAALQKPKKMTKLDWLRRRELLRRLGDQAARAGHHEKAARYYLAFATEYHNPNFLRGALSSACQARDSSLARKIWRRSRKYFSPDELARPLRICKKSGITFK